MQEETNDEARKVYNASIDKRPALIARVADVADVIFEGWGSAMPHPLCSEHGFPTRVRDGQVP